MRLVAWIGAWTGLVVGLAGCTSTPKETGKDSPTDSQGDSGQDDSEGDSDSRGDSDSPPDTGPFDVDGDGSVAAEDCDDSDPTVNPSAAEVCDGIDNNCDGEADEDGVDGALWYADTDGDGFGDPAVSLLACDAPEGYVAEELATDCDDDRADTYPEAPEEDCTDVEQDYNCDGSVGRVDLDGDGFDACFECDDADPAVNPNAPESCDGLDNNCDGATDEGLTMQWFPDADGDGYGDDAGGVAACAAPAGYVGRGGDCDDADPAYNPGAVEADCTDLSDYNCDGSTGYTDADGDGFAACAECDDTEPLATPGGIEVCDGIDNDCDGLLDDGLALTWYEDRDGDGYGNDLVSRYDCSQPVGYAAVGGDCDDSRADFNPGEAEVDCADPNDYNCDGSVGAIDRDSDGYVACQECDDSDPGANPGAAELCDSVDNDCDGTADEGVGQTYYLDGDGDGFGGAGGTALGCVQPAGYAALDGDCDDVDPLYNPGVIEACTDAYDYNCDGSVGYTDADGDGFAACSECDDADAAVNPNAIEACDGLDNDCDGISDEGLVGAWYRDIDGDGYGDAAASAAGCAAPVGYVGTAGDCDDTDPAYNPGASEPDCNNPNDYNCDGSTGYADADGDGFAACLECDDGDAAVNPNASEVCDGVDNDCANGADGVDATGQGTWYADGDGDGFGSDSAQIVSCDQPTGYAAAGGDCDDAASGVRPGAAEICDSLDNDCDSVADEDGGLTFFQDRDGDGYGDPTATATGCSAPAGYVAATGDCDDTSPTINPGAQEVCDAIGRDEDCDALADDRDPSVDSSTQLSWYTDADGDGYGSGATILACAQPAGTAEAIGDCDDSSALYNPGATEDCSATVDYNCDGSTGYVDSDGDGFAACDECDDGDASVNPGAIESCDELDNDCDGAIDEAGALGEQTYYADMDGDTFGTSGNARIACSAPAGFVADSADCDDSSALVSPAATEFCNLRDDDCDTQVDEAEALDASTWYRDLDGDGYGGTDTARACTQPPQHVAQGGDCDELSSAVNPGAQEVCDARDADEDCDGRADDADTGALGQGSFWRDGDGDGYGAGTPTATCDAPAGYVSFPGDCDDASALRNPGAQEVCDGVDLDEDCDGQADDTDPSVSAATQSTWYADGDGDGWGLPTSAQQRCDAPAGAVASGGDCDDANSLRNPGATEVCDATDTDEDCDGQADDNDSGATGQSLFYRDIDGDGYGDPAMSRALCDALAGTASVGTDCDDADAGDHPGAAEIVANGDDEDCDGNETCYDDDDDDGYLDASYDTRLSADGDCADANEGTTTDPITDCDDGNGARSPGVTEVCDALDLDEDCDGQADDADTGGATGQSTWYQDSDGDSYGATSSAALRCEAPAGAISAGGDCDDALASVNPGATEVCDSVDNDCDGAADEGLGATWYHDGDVDGYGDPALSTVSCSGSQPPGYVSNANDCDDTEPLAWTGATEACGDGVDNDCDGLASSACNYAGSYAGSTSTYRLTGNVGSDNMGRSAAIGDLDGDGQDDLIGGMTGHDTTLINVGAAAIWYGPISASGQASGATALLTGASVTGTMGRDLATGDVDGDGIDEVLIGADGVSSSAGAAYLLYGGTRVSGTGSVSMALMGRGAGYSGAASGDLLGTSLGIGDLDGDSLDDMVVGAYQNDGTASNAGAAYVLYGSATRASGVASISTSASATLLGVSTLDYLGYASTIVPDVNGDGLSELMVGAYGRNSNSGVADVGAFYLTLGDATRMSGSGLITASADVAVTGMNNSDNLGYTVGGLGDLNGDGYEDFGASAPNYDYGTVANCGLVAVFAGGAAPASMPSFFLYGASNSDGFGEEFAWAGDIDEDGADDLLVGAPYNDVGGSNAGTTYLFYGPITANTSASASDASFLGGSASSNVGQRLSSRPGDLTGDGRDDIVTAGWQDNTRASTAGTIYLWAGLGGL